MIGQEPYHEMLKTTQQIRSKLQALQDELRFVHIETPFGLLSLIEPLSLGHESVCLNEQIIQVAPKENQYSPYGFYTYHNLSLSILYQEFENRFAQDQNSEAFLDSL